MQLVIYSIILNQHQVPVADEFWEQTGHKFCFVELCNMSGIHKKGDTNDYSQRSYLLRAWESADSWNKAMQLAQTAECCVFGGYEALPFEKARMKQGLLSFDMGERMLKRGWMNLASPRILKMILAYHLGGWRNKPIYKLCCSSFAKDDQYKLLTFKDRCYKWGYFTSVPDLGSNAINSSNDLTLNSTLEPSEEIAPVNISDSTNSVRLMWCARFIDWKHPELPILLAERLKQECLSFQLDMYGDGPLREGMQLKVESLGLKECVRFHGNIPNNQIHQAMRDHEIFLFTSDKNEGWGAVANEAMSEGCCLVGSDAIGSIPYLLKDGVNGLIFKSCNMQDLYKQIRYLIDHPEKRRQMASQGVLDMQDRWSPTNAAKALLQLIEDLKSGRETSIIEGPCSKA